MVPLAILIVLVVALFLLLRTDEVNKGVLLGIRIEDSPGLEVIDGGHPLVALFARVATEEEVTLGFFFLVTVVPHRDRDHKTGSLVADLLGANHVVDEWQFDAAHVVVILELVLLVVEPLQLKLGQRYQTQLDILIHSIALLVELVFEDEAFRELVDLVLDSEDGKSTSSLEEKLGLLKLVLRQLHVVE